MASRTAVVLLAVSMVPALALAQRHGGHGGQGGQGGHGRSVGGPTGGGNSAGSGSGNSGHHHPGNAGSQLRGYGAGLPVISGAPPLGYGNINHPGLGYAPNAVMPGMQPLPTNVQPGIGPIRPGATVYGPPVGYGRYGYPGSYAYGHVHGRGCGHSGYGGYGGYGGPVYIAVPVPVVSGYTYTTDSYSYGNGIQPTPTVIIINNPPAGQAQATEADDRPRHWPKPAAQSAPPPIYETRAPVEQKPTVPITLLVFKDHSIYAVQKYWKEGDRLYYVTSSGVQNSVTLESLDMEFTRRLNDERNVKFEL